MSSMTATATAPQTSTQAAPTATRRAQTLRVATWLALAVAPLLVGVLGYRRRWVAEDAFISFRVSRNIVQGYGPVFNIDERVEAHTNPLWVAILAVWDLLGGRIEHGAIWLGIVFTVLGVVAAQLAAARLVADDADGPALLLPFGTLIFALTPVFWDFVTSGLETGLMFAWLGGTYLGVVLAVMRAGPWRERGAPLTALALGLGPLIRPDLAVFSGLLFLALLAGLFLRGDLYGRPWRAARLLGAVASVPVIYQIFRMGYYAALVPNTALAKATGGTQWDLGRAYLRDFIDPYSLWIPLALLLGALALLLRRAARGRDLVSAILILAPVLAGAIHALYIVRIGGDFMHGRLLLPGLFGLLLPVAVLRVPLRALPRPSGLLRVVAILALAVWGTVAATSLRVPPKEPYALIFVADERRFYVEESGRPNPITIEDYQDFSLFWLRQGQAWERLAQQGAQLLVIDPEMPIMRDEIPPPAGSYPLRDDLSDAITLVGPAWNVGMTGYAAGPHVHIVDRYGLADPIAARVPLQIGGRPGHAKKLRVSWIIARYADPNAAVPFPPDIQDARDALACGDLADLLAAVEEPLTLRRFLSNIRDSWRFTRLTIDSYPSEAVVTLCEGRGIRD
jgi:arabinofuranosyltransferase